MRDVDNESAYRENAVFEIWILKARWMELKTLKVPIGRTLCLRYRCSVYPMIDTE